MLVALYNLLKHNRNEFWGQLLFCSCYYGHPNISWRGLYILPLNLFLPRTVIAARRRSGALSKVYKLLGPRCRQKVTPKNFANHPPNFYRESKSAKFGLNSQNQSPLMESSFETEQHIGNLKHCFGSVDDCSKYRLRNLASPSPIFTQGLKSAKIGLWDAVVSKRRNISLVFCKLV